MAAGWVEIVLPAEVPAGISVMADHCGWETRDLGGRRWEVRQRDEYGGAHIPLLTARKEVTAATSGQDRNYTFLATGVPQDSLDKTGYLWARAQQELQSLLAGSRVDVWNAFGLAVVSAPDAEVAPLVQALFTRIAGDLPDAALWNVSFHPWLMPRHGIATTLFGIQHSAERLRDPTDTGIMLAAHRLQAVSGFHADQYLLPLLLALAPGLLGITSARAGGIVLLTFGNLQAGRERRRAELIDLYWPHMYSSLVQDRPLPPYDRSDLEAAIPWWVDRVSDLVTIAFDPANYVTPTGRHDPTRHLASSLSLDRLFAVVNTILVASRREEFVRTTMLFEALDLLDGLTRNAGDYGYLLSYKQCARVLTRLEQRLPDEVKRLVLPRCREALNALLAVVGGFFISQRHAGSEGLQMNIAGKVQRRSWDDVTHQYLRLLRNGAHSFLGPLEKPINVSLMSSHTGEIAPELADIAFLHLIDLLVHPEQLRSGYFTTPKVLPKPDDADVWRSVSLPPW